jgi:hypothetical protein
MSKLSLLKDELMKLRSAIDSGRDYECPERHDPLYLMFDNDFHLGSSTCWPEYLIYAMDTDPDEQMQEIKNVTVPYNTVGHLEAVWTPLAGPNDEDKDKAVDDVNEESDLIGKPWSYKLEIKKAVGLPVCCDMAYVSYDFFGETFVTEAVSGESATFSPEFAYSRVHHIPNVTQEFIDFLKQSMEMQLHVTQHIDVPSDKIGTANEIVKESILTGDPKGYSAAGAAKPKSDADVKVEQLSKQLDAVTDENAQLKKKIAELEAKIGELEGPKSKTAAALENAKVVDGVLNE